MFADSVLNAANSDQIPFAPGFGGYQRPGEVTQGGGFGEPREPLFEMRSSPRMIRSVVDEAGLGRFVYLLGESGRRYVFSSVRPDQVSLYHHALFAVSRSHDSAVTIGRSVADVIGRGGALYVHLLDDADREGCDTLADLGFTEAG